MIRAVSIRYIMILHSLFIGSQILSLSGVSILIYGMARLDPSMMVLSFAIMYIGVLLYLIVASRISMKLMLGIVR